MFLKKAILFQIPESQNSRIPSLQDSKIPGFQDSWIPRFQDHETSGLPESRISRFQYSQIPGFQASKIPGFQDSRGSGFQDSRPLGAQGWASGDPRGNCCFTIVKNLIFSKHGTVSPTRDERGIDFDCIFTVLGDGRAAARTPANTSPILKTSYQNPYR